MSLSWEEFQNLTPSMFRALCKRRNVRLKHERFFNAETAAAVYNANRVSVEAPLLTGYDFIRCEEASKKRSERLTLIGQIKDSVGRLPCDTSREKLLRVRERILAELVGIGRQDGPELWAECWPDLVPNEGE